jgi:hypothetical protein
VIAENRILKEREDETSQLNRLEWLTFILLISDFDHVITRPACFHKLVGAKLLVGLLVLLRF